MHVLRTSIRGSHRANRAKLDKARGIRTSIGFIILISTDMVEHYELLYILPGTKTEEEIQPIVEQIHGIVNDHGATAVKTEFWGKRKLAYEIDHLRSGYYDLIQFDLDTSKFHDLEKTLGLNEYIIRHQMVRRRVLTPEQQAAITQLQERIAARRQATKDQEAAASIKADADAGMKPKTEPEATPVSTPAEPSEPVTQEQLDKKLEEILESDTIEV